MISKTLATFKIEVRQWDLFKTKATSADSNATKTILDLIEAYLDDRVSIAPNIEESTIALIDETIATAISPLLQDIEALRADIEVLKSDRSISPKIAKKQALEGASTPFHVDSYQKENRTPSRAYTPNPSLDMASSVCLHCGSSELVRKGKSASVDKEGLTGRRVKCKVCQKTSTLWEAVD